MNTIITIWLSLGVLNIILTYSKFDKMHEESTVFSMISPAAFKTIGLIADLVFAPVVSFFLLQDLFSKKEGEK